MHIRFISKIVLKNGSLRVALKMVAIQLSSFQRRVVSFLGYRMDNHGSFTARSCPMTTVCGSKVVYTNRLSYKSTSCLYTNLLVRSWNSTCLAKRVQIKARLSFRLKKRLGAWIDGVNLLDILVEIMIIQHKISAISFATQVTVANCNGSVERGNIAAITMHIIL